MKKTKQIEQNAKVVNKYLNSKLKGNPKKLYDAAGHLIIHGGKRLRPYMVIRSCQIVGGKSSRSLTRLEILNRDYYRGRFCSFTKKNKVPIYNWEETKLN